MTRALLVLNSADTRQKAASWVAKAPAGTRVEFRGPKRSLDQNERLWLCLSVVARRAVWHGQRYTPEDWKDYFMHAYRGGKWMPSEDGGMVPIGRSTSNLSKQEFGELLTLIEAFCARNDVTLPWDPEVAA